MRFLGWVAAVVKVEEAADREADQSVAVVKVVERQVILWLVLEAEGVGKANYSRHPVEVLKEAEGWVEAVERGPRQPVSVEALVWEAPVWEAPVWEALVVEDRAAQVEVQTVEEAALAGRS